MIGLQAHRLGRSRRERAPESLSEARKRGWGPSSTCRVIHRPQVVQPLLPRAPSSPYYYDEEQESIHNLGGPPSDHHGGPLSG